MGIRETLNQNPAITTGATIGIIVIALIFIVMQIIPRGPDMPSESFFTTDDSSPEAALAALFEDDIEKIPPFDHNGKTAYRAQVFTCDKGKTRFVAYIERYTPEAKKRMTELRANAGKPPAEGMPPLGMDPMMTGVEYKKPGGKEWVKMSDFTKINEVMMPKCPDGSNNNLEPVRAD